MSITKDFEKHVERWEEDVSPTAYYIPPPVNNLLAHARSLEAMLRDVRDDVAECLNYELELERLRPDRAEATRKRLEALDKLLNDSTE